MGTQKTTHRETRIVGVISDTHGLLRPEVAKAFNGVDLIVHAGDIGSAEVLDQLRSIAPVVAVRGNNDRDAWTARIAETEVTQVGSVYIYILHDLKEMDLSPSASGFHVVVSGHSHQPSIERRGGVLFINPGSAGPRRFKLPITVAMLRIDGATFTAERVDLVVT